MKTVRSIRPFLEQLEDRRCPTLSVRLLPGNLLISGAPTGNLAITETAPNVFQVQDGSKNLGSYKDPGNLSLNLTNHQMKSVNINLNGNTLRGNLSLNEGTGDTTSNVNFATGIYGGKVAGSVMVTGGSGEETILPGFQAGTANPTPLGLTVGGDCFVTLRPNLGAFAFNVLDTGVISPVAPTVRIGGNLITSAVDALGIGPNTTIGGSLLDNPGGEQVMFLEIAGRVSQNVSFSAGNSPASGTVPQTTLQLDATAAIGGSLSANLGSGTNFATLSAGSVVNDVTLTDQGDATMILEGTITNALAVNLGDGNSALDFIAGATVGSNMTVTAGNGTNDLTNFHGNVGGNLTFNLGNGDNQATLDFAPAGTLSWTSGNGNDTLTLAPSVGGQTWQVNAHFGNVDDTFTLAGAGGNIFGSIDGGGRETANVFNQGPGWTIIGPWTETNFP